MTACKAESPARVGVNSTRKGPGMTHLSPYGQERFLSASRRLVRRESKGNGGKTYDCAAHCVGGSKCVGGTGHTSPLT